MIVQYYGPSIGLLRAGYMRLPLHVIVLGQDKYKIKEIKLSLMDGNPWTKSQSILGYIVVTTIKD